MNEGPDRRSVFWWAAVATIVAAFIAGITLGVMLLGGDSDDDPDEVVTGPGTTQSTMEQPPPDPTPTTQPPPEPEQCWTTSTGDSSNGFEPNNRRSAAFGPIGSETNAGEIGTDNDEDWFVLCVNGETELVVSLALTNCDKGDNTDCFNLFAELIGENPDEPQLGQVELYSLDDPPAEMKFTTPGPGRYFVKVYGDESNEYELRVGPAGSLTEQLPAS